MGLDYSVAVHYSWHSPTSIHQCPLKVLCLKISKKNCDQISNDLTNTNYCNLNFSSFYILTNKELNIRNLKNNFNLFFLEILCHFSALLTSIWFFSVWIPVQHVPTLIQQISVTEIVSMETEVLIITDTRTVTAWEEHTDHIRRKMVTQQVYCIYLCLCVCVHIWNIEQMTYI